MNVSFSELRWTLAMDLSGASHGIEKIEMQTHPEKMPTLVHRFVRACGDLGPKATWFAKLLVKT